MSCIFFNDTATTEIYTLSLHDALPIFLARGLLQALGRLLQLLLGALLRDGDAVLRDELARELAADGRSEEHTSELQSRQYLVCRLLLEKKKLHTYRHI